MVRSAATSRYHGVCVADVPPTAAAAAATATAAPVAAAAAAAAAVASSTAKAASVAPASQPARIKAIASVTPGRTKKQVTAETTAAGTIKVASTGKKFGCRTVPSSPWRKKQQEQQQQQTDEIEILEEGKEEGKEDPGDY